jgi:alkanesulfonate monooxygenase SsuD/methylene tetrahydromethanopterin reductase-like flavin-dependent oxidoreductase (luciferase family)
MAFGAYVAAPVYNRFFEWVGFEDVAKGVAEAFASRDRRAVGEAMTDEFIDAVTILGNADECREKIAAFVEAGVTTPVISPLASNAEAATRTFEALRC